MAGGKWWCLTGAPMNIYGYDVVDPVLMAFRYIGVEAVIYGSSSVIVLQKDSTYKMAVTASNGFRFNNAMNDYKFIIIGINNYICCIYHLIIGREERRDIRDGGDRRRIFDFFFKVDDVDSRLMMVLTAKQATATHANAPSNCVAFCDTSAMAGYSVLATNVGSAMAVIHMLTTSCLKGFVDRMFKE
uniref:uncharacterized protein LOC122597657 n=1 Tax=Erigeron canadensis TaxID=72917 RepID=UPI001CB8B75C|nr:uncharacterized protein LOC122597657 [Erigeron canadensis]